MVILAVRVDSLKSYLRDPALVLEIGWPCPVCKTRVLSRHGAVLRWVYCAYSRQQITVFRLRCRPCRVTATLLPDFLVPYVRYAAHVVEDAVEASVGGLGSFRAVALAISGVVIPPELAPSNTTDAIEVLKPKPGYQRIAAWVARVLDQASQDVTRAAAWATARLPTSTVVSYLTSPLPSTPALPVKRQNVVAAARMLVRIFTAVPELNPTRTGWLAAWLRFVALVARRTPWRGPPRSPPRSPPQPRTS